MRYKQVHDGEWVRPVRRGYVWQCCKCGLVHRVDFRIVNGELQFRAFRVKRKKV
jgi:Zn-finger protein